MVQLFFFMTILTVAALMLNFFWYLDDSYEAEDRLLSSKRVGMSSKNGTITNVSGLSSTICRTVPLIFDSNSNKNNKKNITYHTKNTSKKYKPTEIQLSKYSQMPSSNYKPISMFHDVGTNEDQSFQSIPQNKIECA